MTGKMLCWASGMVSTFVNQGTYILKYFFIYSLDLCSGMESNFWVPVFENLDPSIKPGDLIWTV